MLHINVISYKSKKSVLDIIRGWEELSEVDMNFLKQGVEFALVTIPEALAVEQLDDVFEYFDKHELRIGRLIINNVKMLFCFLIGYT